LRILEKYAGLRSAQLVDIQRQRVEEYRSAVKDLAIGKTAESFAKLDAMGAVLQIEQVEERQKALLQAFLEKKRLQSDSGEAHTVLMVAPMHAEIDEITEHVRGVLQAGSALSRQEIEVERLVARNLTEAEKLDPLRYRLEDVLEPNMPIRGARKGERLRIVQANSDGVKVRDATGAQRKLLWSDASNWSLYEPQALKVAVGDQVRVTKNQVAKLETNDKGARLKNGEILTVGKVDGRRLVLQRGEKPAGIVDTSSGVHLAYGYVVTSHVSQGKTVDHVLVSEPVSTLGVASREQFYVSVSRGRLSAEIFTDSKVALCEAIQLTDYRPSAHDLLEGDAGERIETLKERAKRREARLRELRKIELMRAIGSPTGVMGYDRPVSGAIVECAQECTRPGASPQERLVQCIQAYKARQEAYDKRRNAWYLRCREQQRARERDRSEPLSREA
jgi:ATP-dependent exoDNAse (exonuclease V) alpha subunit